MPLTERTGDPVAGKIVFQKQCAKCHTHSGEGTKVGPDLTGMAVHPKHELLTQMIDPSRSVEGNYRAYTLVTTEGRVFTGLLASETRTSVELFDSEGKRHVILRDDEGRAGPDDIREAAEVAAFFSEARGQARADVHVSRRKHLRAAGGGPGRVRVAHSENVRVEPRDPSGRLRRR